MKKLIIIFLLLPFIGEAQLSTNQKSQVTSMIATAVTKLTTANTVQDKTVTTLIAKIKADSIAYTKKIVALEAGFKSVTDTLNAYKRGVSGTQFSLDKYGNLILTDLSAIKLKLNLPITQ